MLLAERALHYTQRVPWIVEWQVEQVFYKLAGTPEVRQTLDQTRGMTQSLNRFADSIDWHCLPNWMLAKRC